MLAVLSLLWMPVSASAVDWYLESPDVAERADAARVEEIAVRDGFDARVVRRFVDGAGWRYLARIDGFADAGSAGAAASQLAEALGVPLAVLQLDGERVVRIDEARPTGAPVPPGPMDAAPILEAVARAHGTGPETLSALASRPVLLRYRRYLADGRVVRHVWGRDEGGTYVEVTPGDGSEGLRASRTRWVGGKASLSVDGGPWQAQDAAKTAATVEALGPIELLPLVLAVAATLEERPEFERMVVVRGGDAGHAVLRYGGDATSGSIELEVDDARRIRRLSFDEGSSSGGATLASVVRHFDDYRPIDGLSGSLVPWRISTVRGERVDRIEIDVFQVGGDLPDAWFGKGG
jgi:hypothetical protein